VLADALGRNGQINEALAILRTERLSRPNDPYMLNTLGYFLIERTDKLEEGFKVLSRARAMAERDPYIADSLGWAYFKLGHLSEAKRLIELARKELEPHQHWEIEYHLGDIYWYMDDKEAMRKRPGRRRSTTALLPRKRLPLMTGWQNGLNVSRSRNARRFRMCR
jgi:tetratricopeptide (TPR) repeat protein